MTVKEYIEHLQTLDQDKNIWVFYDYPFSAFAPTIDGKATKEASKNYKREGVQPGDYYISAG